MRLDNDNNKVTEKTRQVMLDKEYGLQKVHS